MVSKDNNNLSDSETPPDDGQPPADDLAGAGNGDVPCLHLPGSTDGTVGSGTTSDQQGVHSGAAQQGVLSGTGQQGAQNESQGAQNGSQNYPDSFFC